MMGRSNHRYLLGTAFIGALAATSLAAQDDLSS